MFWVFLFELQKCTWKINLYNLSCFGRLSISVLTALISLWEVLCEGKPEAKAQAWGSPGTPNKYLRRLKHLSLGMPPCIPFFIKQLSGHLSQYYTFITSHNMCCSWSVCIFAFSFVLFCLLVITMSDPCMLDWERYTLHFIIEHSRASLISVECSIYLLLVC